MSSKNSKNWNRILLKLSGEALTGTKEYGIDYDTVTRISSEIVSLHKEGLEVCIVVGGGNIFRGVARGIDENIERSTADGIGMLATVMNALALQSAIEKSGDVKTRVLSAVPMQTICEPYIRRRAVRHLEKGRIVIFAAGTGNPYFTTDTAASLRAAEMNCNAIFKGTKVDGVYDSDPDTNRNARKFKTISYEQVIIKKLNIMDASAIALARENAIPIVVFSILDNGALISIARGNGNYSIIDRG
tara:strand:- start:65 stop:799 length:735 start_codon:yes stop_codon:yes gene_type:complete